MEGDEDEEDHQDDDDGEGEEDQGDADNHRAETIERSLFGGQSAQKLARIMRNLLGLGVKDRLVQRQQAFREANRTFYLDICAALSVTPDDTSLKSDLHSLVIEAVKSLFS